MKAVTKRHPRSSRRTSITVIWSKWESSGPRLLGLTVRFSRPKRPCLLRFERGRDESSEICESATMWDRTEALPELASTRRIEEDYSSGSVVFETKVTEYDQRRYMVSDARHPATADGPRATLGWVRIKASERS
jgi:hypothetical protein